MTHKRTVTKELNWFEVCQNNSGGSFDVDDKLCHRLLIEATSIDEATSKAEDLGCYWDGVSKGTDCECCGDRWSTPYLTLEFPMPWSKGYGKSKADCQLASVEEYAQYLADEYGWTTPDARLYYYSGEVKEIFSKRARR
jgi:hypothetical protein